MEDIEDKVFLDRHSMIAMAILVGCDYTLGGVKYIGPETVLELFSEMRRNGITNILERYSTEYNPFVSYRTLFSQVFFYIIELRNKNMW